MATKATNKARKPLLSSTALAHVRHAAIGIARQERANAETRAQAKADMIAAGIRDKGKQEDLRLEFYAATMASDEYPDAIELTDAMLAEGKRLLSVGGAASSKPDRRTSAQDTTYGRARTAWTRMLQDCGAVSVNAKAKATKAPAGATKVGKSGDKPEAPSKPAVAVCTSAKDAHAYFEQQASTMLLYCNKNAAKVPAALKSAAMDFREAVKAWTPND